MKNTKAYRAITTSALLWLGSEGAMANPALHSIEPEAAIDASRTAIAAQEYMQAANILEQALLAAPNNLELNRMLGIGYYKNGQTTAALKQLERTLAMAPEDGQSHYALGVVYLARAGEVSALRIRGLLKQSIEHLETSIRLEPQHAAAHYYLIQVLLNAPKLVGGDQERAIALNTRLAELSPLHHQMVNSTLAAKAEDYARAEAILQALHKEHPDSSLVNFALLSHHHDREQFGKAIGYGEKFIALPKSWDDSDVAGAHLLLAQSYRAQGDKTQSLQHYALTLTHSDNPKLIEQVQAEVKSLEESS